MGLGDMRNPQSFYSSYITLLLRADTIARYQQSIGIPANIAGLENASELGARLLASIAEWAKNIPFFSEFTLPDQSILLRSCWSELFILSAAQHCSPFHMAQPLTISALSPSSNGDVLAVSNDGPVAFDSAENQRLFEEQVEKLKNLHIDSAEFCCLKAIILFNPGKHDCVSNFKLRAGRQDGARYCDFLFACAPSLRAQVTLTCVVLIKGEYHGIAHVLAVANVTVYNAIGSDVTVCAGNLHVWVKTLPSP